MIVPCFDGLRMYFYFIFPMNCISGLTIHHGTKTHGKTQRNRKFPKIVCKSKNKDVMGCLDDLVS